MGLFSLFKCAKREGCSESVQMPRHINLGKQLMQ